jgi:hypothetical protein
LDLATALIAHIPILGVDGASVIAGFVVILYAVGTDAFCDFVRDRDWKTENAQKETQTRLNDRFNGSARRARSCARITIVEIRSARSLLTA